MKLGLAEAGQRLVSEIDPTSVLLLNAQIPGALALDRLNSLIVIPTFARFDATDCWIKMHPGTTSSADGVLRTVFNDPDVRISAFRETADGSADPRDQWSTYVSLEGWAAVALVIGFVSFVFARFRKSQLAIYQVLGARKHLLLLMMALELFAVLIPATLLATTVSFLVVAAASPYGNLDSVMIAVATYTGASGLAGAGFSICAAAIALQGPVARKLRDR